MWPLFQKLPEELDKNALDPRPKITETFSKVEPNNLHLKLSGVRGGSAIYLPCGFGHVLLLL